MFDKTLFPVIILWLNNFQPENMNAVRLDESYLETWTVSLKVCVSLYHSVVVTLIMLLHNQTTKKQGFHQWEQEKGKFK